MVHIQRCRCTVWFSQLGEDDALALLPAGGGQERFLSRIQGCGRLIRGNEEGTMKRWLQRLRGIITLLLLLVQFVMRVAFLLLSFCDILKLNSNLKMLRVVKVPYLHSGHDAAALYSFTDYTPYIMYPISLRLVSLLVDAAAVGLDDSPLNSVTLFLLFVPLALKDEPRRRWYLWFALLAALYVAVIDVHKGRLGWWWLLLAVWHIVVNGAVAIVYCFCWLLDFPCAL